MADARDDFYVGYRPLPWGHSRFLRVLIPTSLWIIALVAGTITFAQRDPGPAIWTTAAPETFVGRLDVEPYPTLTVPSESGPRTLLVVEAGKFGAQARLAPFDGTAVTLTGFTLEREGRTMIELVTGDEAVVAGAGGTRLPPVVSLPLGASSLRGEIMDGKCHLGAMKPGDGVAHRACARLCIEGGIPPLLRVEEEAGVSFVLLTGPDGTRLPSAFVSHVGEIVRVSGALRREGDLLVMEVANLRTGPGLDAQADASGAGRAAAGQRTIPP